jgi:hypothetical protein
VARNLTDKKKIALAFQNAASLPVLRNLRLDFKDVRHYKIALAPNFRELLSDNPVAELRIVNAIRDERKPATGTRHGCTQIMKVVNHATSANSEHQSSADRKETRTETRYVENILTPGRSKNRDVRPDQGNHHV